MTESPATGPAATSAKKPGLVRRLYDWVLHWAETPYGGPALAVLSFENSMKNPELDWIGIGFAETITTKLARVRGIRVVERRQIEKAFAELKLSLSGAVDPSTAQQVGKFVGAQYNLIGSFQKLDTPSGSQLMINARVMKTETAEIFMYASVTALAWWIYAGLW